MPSEMALEFTKEEEIYKPSSMANQPFTHIFRVNSNLSSYTKNNQCFCGNK